MQELTVTAEPMLETAAALLQAAQQVRRPLDNTDAHGLSSLARRMFMHTLWTQRYAQRTQHMHSSVLGDLVKIHASQVW
jgi:hypothetical protein